MNKESDPHGLRKKTNQELCVWIASWNDDAGRGNRLIGEEELNRRFRSSDAFRSWVAIGISLVALVISVFKK
jgi:hypothetical protein